MGIIYGVRNGHNVPSPLKGYPICTTAVSQKLLSEIWFQNGSTQTSLRSLLCYLELLAARLLNGIVVQPLEYQKIKVWTQNWKVMSSILWRSTYM